MGAVLAPGVYYQTYDAGSPPVHPLRTDITGFVGLAERGPIDVPVAVESWRQFVSWFGRLSNVSFLAYAVKGFFENGGKRAWVVRVASLDDPSPAASASATVQLVSATDAWTIQATTPGAWGNALTVKLQEKVVATTKTIPMGGESWSSTVDSVSSIAAGDLVRLTQSGVEVWRVVASTDTAKSIVYWMNPDRSLRKEYESGLESSGLDLNSPILLESVMYAMVVESGREVVAVYDQLSSVPGHSKYAPDILRAIETDPVTGGVLEANKPPHPISISDVRTAPSDFALGFDIGVGRTYTLSGGADGLSQLSHLDLMGDDSDWRGIKSLERVTEIGLICCPDAQPRAVEVLSAPPLETCVPDPCWDPPVQTAPKAEAVATELPPTFSDQQMFLVQSSLVDQAEFLRDRIALIDPPFATNIDLMTGMQDAMAWRQLFDTEFAAMYYPWLDVADPNQGTAQVSGSSTQVGVRTVPPCGHVSGAIAATDLSTGVHKAPANVALEWALSPAVGIGMERHAVLNDLGVNVVRTSPGGDVRILGARTMSSDTDWRYLNVRRLMSMLEKALDISCQWAVFEPNDYLTRARLVMGVTGMLMSLHESGALVGETPAESFYIKCDLDNNPQSSRDNGQLIMEIGVAPTVPFEFIILRVGRLHESFEVTVSGRSNAQSGAGASC